jgi:hypothetical protein
MKTIKPKVVMSAIEMAARTNKPVSLAVACNVARRELGSPFSHYVVIIPFSDMEKINIPGIESIEVMMGPDGDFE